MFIIYSYPVSKTCLFVWFEFIPSPWEVNREGHLKVSKIILKTPCSKKMVKFTQSANFDQECNSLRTSWKKNENDCFLLLKFLNVLNIFFLAKIDWNSVKAQVISNACVYVSYQFSNCFLDLEYPLYFTQNTSNIYFLRISRLIISDL